MDGLFRDLRFAFRTLARNPGFTATALLTLALGIGANAAMFSIVNGILLRPLPFPEPDRLVRLYQASPERGLPHAAISPLDLEDWRTRARSFTGIGGFFSSGLTLTGRGEPEELASTYVTEDFFRVLGVRPERGRTLLPDDARQARRVAVISEGLWRGRFGADPSIIGATVELRGQPHEVVGIMPASLRYPSPETQVWVPASLITEDMIPRLRQVRYLGAVARLRPGVSVEQARAELASVATELERKYPESNQGWGSADAVELKEALVGDVDTALLVVLATVGFVLLIVCANLANLLLARSTARSREIAVRVALGAGRTRLVRQLLTESLALSLLGGLVGIGLSVWVVQAVVASNAGLLPRVADIRLDARVIAYALSVTVLTGVLFGIVPALKAAHSDPQNTLRGGRGAGGGGQRLRNTLVVAEVALAVVLVIGAGLMARSFVELRNVDPGFDPERALTVGFQINVPAGLPAEELMGRIVTRKEEIIQRVRALPGVQAVGTIKTLPLRGEGEMIPFTRADGAGSGDDTELRVDAHFVSPDYFRAMGIPLRRGSSFPEREAPDAPEGIVISETAARRFWPGEDPVGKIVRMGPDATATVIGVVGDVRQMGLARDPEPTVYLSQRQAPRLDVTLVVRTAGNPMALAGPIRAAIHDLDPNQPIRDVATLGSVVDESVARDRFFSVLFGIFGVLALVLAAVGIYGVLAYSVGQRTREIGVRMALGARAADVLRMVLGRGMLLVGTGVLLGTAAALALTRVLKSLLFGVGTTDPFTFAAVPVLLALVALLAAYFPARRATRVDPMVALRAE